MTRALGWIACGVGVAVMVALALAPLWVADGPQGAGGCCCGCDTRPCACDEDMGGDDL